jgi:hypothetical protein
MDNVLPQPDVCSALTKTIGDCASTEVFIVGLETWNCECNMCCVYGCVYADGDVGICFEKFKVYKPRLKCNSHHHSVHILQDLCTIFESELITVFQPTSAFFLNLKSHLLS